MTGSKQGKKINIILNGISSQKKLFYKRILPALQSIARVEVLETKSTDDGMDLANKAVKSDVDIILAAGGDGTLHQVINGALAGREEAANLPVFGLIPLGSGNDFARTTNVRRDPAYITNLIRSFSPKLIDIGKISFTTDRGNQGMRYFANMADIGMGPMVVKKVGSSSKLFGAAFAYYKSILSTFIAYKPMEVEARTSDWTWKGKLRTLGVGNGRCYGHGLYITPDARLDDRTFDVFICGNVSVFDFVKHTSTLKKARHINIPDVHYKRGTCIDLKADSICFIEGDGEVLGTLPARIEVINKQILFLF